MYSRCVVHHITYTSDMKIVVPTTSKIRSLSHHAFEITELIRELGQFDAAAKSQKIILIDEKGLPGNYWLSIIGAGVAAPVRYCL